MKISIKDLKINAVLGILESERKKPQKITVDIDIYYSYDGKSYIDYALVASAVSEDISQSGYGLIEDALESLSAMLKERFPAIERLRISISKPDILKECSVSVEMCQNY